MLLLSPPKQRDPVSALYVQLLAGHTVETLSLPSPPVRQALDQEPLRWMPFTLLNDPVTVTIAPIL